MVRSGWGTAFILATFCIFISPLIVAAGGEAEKIVGVKYVCYETGLSEEFFVVRNLETDEISFKKPHEIPDLVRSTFALPAKAEIDGLTPWFVLPYLMIPEKLSEVEFHLNQVTDQRRALYKDIIDNIINKYRGTKKKPKIILKDQVIDTSNYEYNDFIDDGYNTIYVHADDRTWEPSFAGESIGMAWVHFDYEKAECSGADISFTYKLFQDHHNPREVQCTVHEFGHVLGYLHTSWVEDYMSYVGPWYVYNHHWPQFNDVFLKPRSWAWRMSKLKDKMVYGGRERKGIYVSKVKILPYEGCLIDLDYIAVDLKDIYRSRHMLVLTTLKAYKNKPMEMAIYRGERTVDKRLILKISGYHPVLARRTYDALRKFYDASYLYFTRQADYDKLEAAVKKWGVPHDHCTMHYPTALWCTIVVTGYESEDSEEAKTLSTKVWFGIRDKPWY